ncbi:MAG: Rieske 2Fe-2S domain-containing protein [Candidatus Izemoplasmatales bacterium]
MEKFACDWNVLVKEGKIRTEIDGKPYLVVVKDGKPYALSDVCPHMGGSLSEGAYADGKITCPRHKARFDVVTGEVEGRAKILFVKLPTAKAKTVPARVADGRVLIDL